MWLTILSIVAIAYAALITSWVLLEARSPASTVAWILALNLVPVVSIPLYLLIGPRRFTRRRLRHARARLKVRSQHPRDPVESSALRAALDSLSPRWRQLVRVGTNASDAPATLAQDITVYTSGRTCFDAMEADIRAATHHVHVLYYIFEPDETGRRTRDLLVEKAKSGVAVRMLVDAVGSPRLKADFLRPLVEAGVDVARFNVPRLFGLLSYRSRANFRNHRKIVVCDGKVGYTGGLNVADEYLSGKKGGTPWRDTHLRLSGAPVRWLQLLFLEDWQFAAGTSPAGSSYFPAIDGPGRHLVQVVGSGPDMDVAALHMTVFTAIACARRRIWITTPYFVPDESILEALSAASYRGVDVRVLVPRENDEAFVATAARSYYDELLRAGIRIFEFLPTMLHAKTMVVDDDLAMIGTGNIDNRSLRLNFEVAALIYGTAHAAELAAIFEEDVHQSAEVYLAERQKLALAQRVLENGARVCSPLL